MVVCEELKACTIHYGQTNVGVYCIWVWVFCDTIKASLAVDTFIMTDRLPVDYSTQGRQTEYRTVLRAAVQGTVARTGAAGSSTLECRFNSSVFVRGLVAAAAAGERSVIASLGGLT
jgi:hypothetical protein